MHVGLFGTPWPVTCQAPLAMAFFRQEYWSGLTFPTSGDLLNPGIKPKSVLDLEISLLTDLIPHLEPAAMFSFHPVSSGVPWWLTEQRICLQCRKPRLNPWVRKTPWRKVWQSTPVFLPREFHGQRAIVHGVTKSQTRLSDFHFSPVSSRPPVPRLEKPSAWNNLQSLTSVLASCTVSWWLQAWRGPGTVLWMNK